MLTAQVAQTPMHMEGPGQMVRVLAMAKVTEVMTWPRAVRS
jgi:hypothetical protein